MMCAASAARGEPGQDFPSAAHCTGTHGDAVPPLTFSLNRMKSRHISTARQPWHKAHQLEVWDSQPRLSGSASPAQPGTLPASGSLCSREGRAAAPALQPAVRAALWGPGSRIWEAAGFGFLHRVEKYRAAPCR